MRGPGGPMIKDFEATKRQLGELAEVINKFTSEAVQLRIVELIFGASPNEAPEDGPEEESPIKRTPKSKRRRAKTVKAAVSGDDRGGPKARRNSSGGGAVSTL